MKYATDRRRVEGTDNSGLAKGFIRCREPEVEQLLGQFHEAEIDFYLATRLCLNQDGQFFPGYDVQESLAKGPLFPKGLITVESYHWYGGVAVSLGSGTMILFHPWMQPGLEGGAPDPIIYATPETAVSDILEAVKVFCENKLRRMEELRLNPPPPYEEEFPFR